MPDTLRTVAERIRRVEFGGQPPAALVRVLAIYVELGDAPGADPAALAECMAIAAASETAKMLHEKADAALKCAKAIRSLHASRFKDEEPIEADGDDDGGDADPEKTLDRLQRATTELQIMQHAERVENDTHAKRAEQARLQVLSRFNRY